MVFSRKILCLSIFACGLAPYSAMSLDFGKILKQNLENLNKGTSQSPSQSQLPVFGAGPSKAGGGSAGSSLTDAYCRRLFSTAGFSKRSPIDQNLVLEEFNLKSPGDFFDAFISAKHSPTYTFPSLRFYQGEFETDRVNVLYDLILSYPSPQYLAALITEARKVPGAPQYDNQMRTDAIAALAMLHHTLKNYSKNPNRWWDYVQMLQNEEHYTARVITARGLASGDFGNKDVSRALTYVADANNFRMKYTTDQSSRTMSSRNYAVNSNRTVYEIVSANPKLPQSQYYLQFAQKYGATLKNPQVAPELEAQLGPSLRMVEKSASEAARKATELLDGARQTSLLKAEKVSLDSAMKTRTSDSPVDANIDDSTHMRIAREMQKLEGLDEQQKKLFSAALRDAHESGDRAIATMPVMMSAIFNLMNQRGIEAMPAIIPYARKFQAYSDNACSVISRWDQAALVTKASEEAPRTSLAALVAESDK